MLSFFPRDVLDEILNLIESVSEGFPTYSSYSKLCACILTAGVGQPRAIAPIPTFVQSKMSK